jgi:hypothetical protein
LSRWRGSGAYQIDEHDRGSTAATERARRHGEWRSGSLACARREAGAEGCECANEGRGGQAGARRLEIGQGGDVRGLGVCRWRGLHGDA